MPLVRVVEPAVVVAQQLLGSRFVDVAAGDDRQSVHEHAAAGLVGLAVVEQRLRQVDDRRDEGVRARLVHRLADRQRGHVLVEVELLDGGEAVVLRTCLGGRLEQHVVDVGDVAADLDLHAEPSEHPVDRVDPDEGRRMTQVRHVVRRHAAHVDVGASDDRQGAAPEDEARQVRVCRHTHSLPCAQASSSAARASKPRSGASVPSACSSSFTILNASPGL